MMQVGEAYSTMGAMRSAYKISIARTEGRHHFGEIGIDERIILK
jgi:hypothetical protein